MNIISGLVHGQVLQRIGSQGATAVIVGTSEENGAMVATVFGSRGPLKGWKKRPVGKAVRGKFKVKLSGIPAGGPYRLRLEVGKERADITSFFVGDVWILAGQSNMEGVGKMTGAAKPHPLVRAFSLRREWRLAVDPIHVLIESPDVCHHNSSQCSAEQGETLRKARKGVGVGIFFGREMVRRSGVPQGLIATAHGGTSMEQWSPGRKQLGGESLYASMLASVAATGQPVAGVLWYQGESDADETNAPQYTARMKKLVAASRKDLKQARLPWIMVQIARVFGQQRNSAWWKLIQEQQRLLPGKIKYLETVAAIDLALDDFIHIGSDGLAKLALRLARQADRLVHRNARELQAPQLQVIRVLDPAPEYSIEVSYRHVRGGLRAKGEPNGFTVVPVQGEPLPIIFRTLLRGNTAVLLLSSEFPEGSRLSYGHGFIPLCNITDANDSALPVFGPLAVGNKIRARFPYVTQWKVTGVVPATEALDKIPPPEVDQLGATVKTYSLDGFINERPQWMQKTGQAFFQARLDLPEPMKLEFGMGYDGPFRLWLDGKSFFTDMNGINPCLADKAKKTIALDRGAHDIRVGMDLNHGRSWGFFLRFCRKDLSRAQMIQGDYQRPVYAV